VGNFLTSCAEVVNGVPVKDEPLKTFPVLLQLAEFNSG